MDGVADEASGLEAVAGHIDEDRIRSLEGRLQDVNDLVRGLGRQG